MGFIDPTGCYVHHAHAHHDPGTMLRFVAARLVSGGYHLTGQGEGWISAMRGPVGFLGAHALNQGHAITVRSTGHTVTFEVRGQVGLGPNFALQIDAVVGETLMAYDSMMLQQRLMGAASSGPQSWGGYPPAPHSQPGPVSTHVVEKQVVVVRCKFCQAHTPLDAATCRACGAAKFT